MTDRDVGSSRWARRVAEGLTIVFSILLALGADATWDWGRDRAEESRLLDGLTEEFQEAAAEVQSDLAARDEIHDRLGLALAARGGRAVIGDSVAVIVSALLDWRFYTPGHAVLDDAMSSGRFDLIRSADVRAALMSYEQQRRRLEVFDARERDFVSDQLEPYLVVRLPLDRLVAEAPAPPDLATFRSLTENDDTFASLVTLKRQRTEEAMTFSRVVGRRIDDVLASLDGSH